MTNNYETVVFCGSSIAIEEARKILPLAYFPGPIARGDLERYEAKVYCIIDGFFLQNLAVSPKEIMEKLCQGRQVLGAASMGALRAAECSPFGMRGVGTIFEMYRSGQLTSDDEVALSLLPENFLPISDALVDVRLFLKKAVQQQWVHSKMEEIIIERLQAIYFTERNFKQCLLELHREGLLEWHFIFTLLENFYKQPLQKHLDAVECLKATKALIYGKTVQ